MSRRAQAGPKNANDGRAARAERDRKESEETCAPAKRLNQRDMDSVCYRLSRLPRNATRPESNPTYASVYFASNEPDYRDPKEKLEDVEAQIAEVGDFDNLLPLLIKKHTLCKLAFGENSPENFNSITDVGALYNANERQGSALRHLVKGQAIGYEIDVDENDMFRFAVELATCCLEAAAETKGEKGRQVSTADASLTPLAEAECADVLLSYRRYLCLARMRSYRYKFTESLTFYTKAVDLFSEAHTNGEENDTDEDAEERRVDEANLCVEAGRVAEYAEMPGSAVKFYRRARGIYADVGYDEDAEMLTEKIEAQGEGEEPEEEGQQSHRSENLTEQMTPRSETCVDDDDEADNQAPSVTGSKAGSQAPSVTGSKAGSQAPSVTGSKAGSQAPSVAGSREGSQAPSVAGSREGSRVGSSRPQDGSSPQTDENGE